MIILRNKYFSNEESKNKNKKLAIGAAIGTTGAVAGGIAGKILNNKASMSSQEKSIYDKYKGDTSEIVNKMQQEKEAIKDARRRIHKSNRKNLLRFKDVIDYDSALLSKEARADARAKLAKFNKRRLEEDPVYRARKKNIEKARYNLSRLEGEKSTIEKVLKRRKTNSRIGLAIGAGAGAALATGAYLLGNKYTIKPRNS